jgi:uncharacterized protein YciI
LFLARRAREEAVGVRDLDFFVYSRDAAGTEALRNDVDLLEKHWSYMDAFAESMVARGPTFGTDRETVTGSLHVLGLPDLDAVREFVAQEPNNRAGVYAEHLVWRFENLLGRTMWEFPHTADQPKFIVVALTARTPTRLTGLTAALRERLILYGRLGTLDEAEPVGVAVAVQAQNRRAVAALVEDAGIGDANRQIEIHDWEFGGRR